MWAHYLKRQLVMKPMIMAISLCYTATLVYALGRYSSVANALDTDFKGPTVEYLIQL